MIYVTSDLHLCHDRDFLYGPRGFTNIEDHNREIVKKWNSLIKYEDTVYVLGDLMLNNTNEGIRLFNQLNGQKIIIRGNHDTDARVDAYRALHDTTVVGWADVIKYNGYHFFICHYPVLTANMDDDEKPLKKKLISICGHVHTQDKFHDWDKGLIYHIELDAHDNMPVSLDQVIEDIKNKYSEKPNPSY